MLPIPITITITISISISISITITISITLSLSSRFGKFTKIVFKEDLVKIAGSFIETYLLEKSRVTHL
jgi:hypothetical protein